MRLLRKMLFRREEDLLIYVNQVESGPNSHSNCDAAMGKSRPLPTVAYLPSSAYNEPLLNR